jgi:hypothetical protein
MIDRGTTAPTPSSDEKACRIGILVSEDARASAAADRLRTPHAVEALLRRLMELERDE